MYSGIVTEFVVYKHNPGPMSDAHQTSHSRAKGTSGRGSRSENYARPGSGRHIVGTAGNSRGRGTLGRGGRGDNHARPGSGGRTAGTAGKKARTMNSRQRKAAALQQGVERTLAHMDAGAVSEAVSSFNGSCLRMGDLVGSRPDVIASLRPMGRSMAEAALNSNRLIGAMRLADGFNAFEGDFPISAVELMQRMLQNDACVTEAVDWLSQPRLQETYQFGEARLGPREVLLSFVANNQAGAAQLFLERLVKRYPKEYALDTVRFYLDRITAGPAPPVWGVGMARVATDALSKIHDLRTMFPTSPPRFLDLTVPVVLVDTPALVSRAHDALRDPAVDVVGVDREARPCFVAGGFNPSSLLQIATRGTVYLFDLRTLGGAADPLLQWLFGAERPLKAGLGWQQDLHDLCRSYPGASAFRRCAGSLDLVRLANVVIPNTKMSLHKLCLYALGSGLKKTCQMSNWDNRPLTKAQLHYAALDAHAAVLLHDVLVEQVRASSPEASGDDPRGVYGDSVSVVISKPPK
mmetsp:Transcript_1412/g.3043  ORF Transcript_1412/g.3043 Transcript_1412/m.3043 type:complete len:521 (-) Transcript_1412:131-1693(-)